ncbi:hypothetical protein N7510_006137 [Penicillium lagena]|uniref:uncharacterized protein n=1 Tax=Penicillium lagena TaxID=94218 RepID=UPI002540D5B8|nr:uncharacterized protein N7510_006137 [Penicillium lagena]KAJ5612943.1 hypothetical protein N7510_006137 [Penicillium lagena]
MQLTRVLAIIGAELVWAAATSRADAAPVKSGIQVLLENAKELKSLQNNHGVGIVTNPTGSLPNLINDVYVLQSENVTINSIFSPEQGFNGAQQAGSSSGGYIDPQSGVPVQTLYALTPQQMLASFRNQSVDTILFDLQDVGARFYTYVWTMAWIMEGIAGTNITLIVLDRPNPINGVDVEGPLLNMNYTSGVGLFPIPLRHGMTTGELALMFNDKFIPNHTGGRKAKVEVVWMEGWTRDMYYDDTGLPFILPSANLPTLDSVIVYPGTGLIEGTNISEGRGTTKPFQLLGATWIDWHLARAMQSENLPGTAWREAAFMPEFDKYANQTATGVELYITDRSVFSPLRTTIALLVNVRKLYPSKFEFIPDDFDILSGSAYIRTAIEAGKNTNEIVTGWQEELRSFMRLRTKYLHY